MLPPAVWLNLQIKSGRGGNHPGRRGPEAANKPRRKRGKKTLLAGGDEEGQPGVFSAAGTSEVGPLGPGLPGGLASKRVGNKRSAPSPGLDVDGIDGSCHTAGARGTVAGDKGAGPSSRSQRASARKRPSPSQIRTDGLQSHKRRGSSLEPEHDSDVAETDEEEANEEILQKLTGEDGETDEEDGEGATGRAECVERRTKAAAATTAAATMAATARTAMAATAMAATDFQPRRSLRARRARRWGSSISSSSEDEEERTETEDEEEEEGEEEDLPPRNRTATQRPRLAKVTKHVVSAVAAATHA